MTSATACCSRRPGVRHLVNLYQLINQFVKAKLTRMMNSPLSPCPCGFMWQQRVVTALRARSRQCHHAWQRPARRASCEGQASADALHCRAGATKGRRASPHAGRLAQSTAPLPRCDDDTPGDRCALGSLPRWPFVAVGMSNDGHRRRCIGPPSVARSRSLRPPRLRQPTQATTIVTAQPRGSTPARNKSSLRFLIAEQEGIDAFSSEQREGPGMRRRRTARSANHVREAGVGRRG